jgi:3,4-dihydroxy 2-butanone 4-phosphate synthase/GTP cyclohydrolase II
VAFSRARIGVGVARARAVSDETRRQLETRNGVTCLAGAMLPTRVGNFRIHILRCADAASEVLALVRGDLAQAPAPLVRLQSECVTGEVFGSLRCDCGPQLTAALERIAADGPGAVLYLRQEGRGIGLVNKIRAYALQDLGLDTVDANLALGLPADGRDYSAAARALDYFGVRSVRLLTNNPQKSQALENYGIRVIERVPLEIAPNSTNRAYLRTKARRLGHLLTVPDWAPEPTGDGSGAASTGR